MRRPGISLPRRGAQDQRQGFETYGICLRGKAGWGENMAFPDSDRQCLSAPAGSIKLEAAFDQPEWKNTLDFVCEASEGRRPPGASSNGFNENLALLPAGKCGMWIDATVAASFVHNPKDSSVADKVGFALAPDNVLASAAIGYGRGRSRYRQARRGRRRTEVRVMGDQQALHDLVRLQGRLGEMVPPAPGRRSTRTPKLKAAPFAQMTIDIDHSADPNHPTVKPVSHVGVQFVAIPEFQGIGTADGQFFSAALAATPPSMRR